MFAEETSRVAVRAVSLHFAALLYCGGSRNRDSAWWEGKTMADDPVELDEHRGMAAQKSTEIRRRPVGKLGRGCSKGPIFDRTIRCDARGAEPTPSRADSEGARRLRQIIAVIRK